MSRVHKRPSTCEHEPLPASSAQLQESSNIPDPGRSCISCHKRKVRCDRKLPCTQCVRSNWSCSYPTPDRETAKKVSPFQDITTRLERLEAKLLEAVDKQSFTQPSPAEKSSPILSEHQPKRARTRQPDPSRWEVLLRHGNQVHYVDNTNLLDLFQDEARMNPTNLQQHEDEDTSPQPSPPDGLHLTLGIAPVVPVSSRSWNQLYPEPQLALRLWTTYAVRVDPLIKILHIPTTQSTMIGLIANPTGTDPSSAALAFAIYFAATTSLDGDEVSAMSSDGRQVLSGRYRDGLNRVIMEGNLLNEPDVTSLQAITIFATCLRVHEISRSVWVLIGVAIRLAQSIGIHRDGASLKLSPYESEIRLRLWWQLCLLDSRAPEDHGFMHTIEHLNQGLRPPLNIDDDQIFPAMKTLPQDSDCWTEMTFQLVQIEACKLLQQVVESGSSSQVDIMPDLAAKRKMMERHDTWMQRRFFSKPTTSKLQRVASIHYHSACAKMAFVLQLREHLYASKDERGSQPTAGGLGKQCLLSAFRDIESNYSLLNGTDSGQFAWIFRMYTKWYSLMYALRYLCTFPSSPEAEMGWALVDRTVKILPYFQTLPAGDISSKDTSGTSVWRCLAMLYRQALKSRGNVPRPPSSNASTLEPVANADQGAKPQSSCIEIQLGRQLGRQLEVQPPAQNPPSPSMFSGDPLRQWYPNRPGVLDSTTTWQDPYLSFDDFAASEMLYVPEWSDIVNRSLDLS